MSKNLVHKIRKQWKEDKNLRARSWICTNTSSFFSGVVDLGPTVTVCLFHTRPSRQIPDSRFCLLLLADVYSYSYNYKPVA